MDEYLRLVAQKKDLDERVARLATFVITDTAEALPDDERKRLFRQLFLMCELSEVLDERIKNFA